MKNAIKYSNLLQEVGLSKQQAEAHLGILEEIVDVNLATKTDILELKSEMRELNDKIDREVVKLEIKIEALEHKLVNKIGLIVTAGLAAIATFFKFFI